MRAKQYIELNQKNYFGGKAGEGTYQKIINEFPIHETYVAGFLGLDAIMRYKRPAKFNIGIEINKQTVDIWSTAKYNTSDITPSNLTIIDKDFFSVNLPCLHTQTTLLYLDPPYMHSERLSNSRYEFELNENQHIQLLDRAKRLGCMVAISCYDNQLYQQKLSHWRKIQFEAVTRGGTMATETLYMNFSEVPPNKLHDKSFLGDNYRTREVSRKRINTIHRKIERLDAKERAILFDELQKPKPGSITKNNGVGHG